MKNDDIFSLNDEDQKKLLEQKSSSNITQKYIIIGFIILFLILITIIIILSVKLSSKSENETEDNDSIDYSKVVGEINCIFNIENINKDISILSNEYQKENNNFDILINNKKIKDSKIYKFPSNGLNTLKYVLYGDINMDNMFKNIQQLTSVSMTSTKNTKITSMISTFEACINLQSFDINGFDYTELKSMRKTFYKTNILNLNIKDLKTN